jgi:hypothetical protein
LKHKGRRQYLPENHNKYLPKHRLQALLQLHLVRNQPQMPRLESIEQQLEYPDLTPRPGYIPMSKRLYKKQQPGRIKC